MAESEYSKYILKTPKGELHTGDVFEGFLASPDKLGVDCQILYSVITEADLEGDEIEPHVHDFSHVMCFFGSNPFDKYDFDAEIEFYMEGEKQIIDTPAMVTVPAGITHCPLIFKRIGKPVTWVEVMLTSHYGRE
ncbi:hypothetical protein ACFL1N_07545 [Thermodesulfobacteriota bacterium]